MKRKLITLSFAGALALGSIATLSAGYREPGGERGRGGHGGKGGFALERLTTKLNLTAEQETQVAPIIAQAKPQIRAIHQEAMEKTRHVVETTTAQIRPLLTAEQQAKLDQLQAAHEKMREARREMKEARK